jgi:DNA-binding MarR family transcriptional regulator
MTKKTSSGAADAHPVLLEGKTVSCPAPLADMALTLTLIELQFFVQVALVKDSDAVLAKMGYGRAHHRALYFIARQPGITSKDLTDNLGISNQALAKVLGTLIQDGLVTQKSDAADRRLKRCEVTTTGMQLLRKVFRSQSARIERAVASVSGADLKGHVRLYTKMLEPGTEILDFPG